MPWCPEDSWSCDQVTVPYLSLTLQPPSHRLQESVLDQLLVVVFRMVDFCQAVDKTGQAKACVVTKSHIP